MDTAYGSDINTIIYKASCIQLRRDIYIYMTKTYDDFMMLAVAEIVNK